MAPTMERTLSVVLTVCAMVIVGLLIRREFFVAPEVPRVGAPGPPVPINNWDEIRGASVSLGQPDERRTILTFADLECPACKRLHSRLHSLEHERGARFNVLFVHFPLSIHRFSRLASRALECADSVGASARFVEAAYAKQDSFGLKAWADYAREAGVGDTSRFNRCVQDTVSFPRITQGRALGDAMALEGTPTVVINGWRFSTTPSDEQILAFLDSIPRPR